MNDRTEEIKEQPKRRRKKKKRFGYYLYAVVILVLTIANISLSLFLLTYVQRIDVKGTSYSSQQKIQEWIKEDKLTVNSLYTVCKFKIGKYKLPAYLESVDVNLSAPWALEIEVKEKTIAGCVLSNTGFVYFAEDGTVLIRSSEKREGIPVVEGVKVQESTLYSKLKTSDEKIPTYIIKLTREIKNNDLNPDRIVWAQDGMEMYYGDICVKVGKTNYEERFAQISPCLEELKGQKGTLHLEYFNENSTSISFKKEK